MPALLTEQPIQNPKSKIQNPQHDRAIIALLTQPSIVDAARACGLGESTLRRWLHQPDFAHAYSQARQQAFSVALGYLQNLSEEAVHTIQSLMQDPQISPSVRLSAARTVLQMSFKTAEMSTRQPSLYQPENGLTTLESEQQSEDPYPQPQSKIEFTSNSEINSTPAEGEEEGTEDDSLNRSNPLYSVHTTASFPPLQSSVGQAFAPVNREFGKMRSEDTSREGRVERLNPLKPSHMAAQTPALPSRQPVDLEPTQGMPIHRATPLSSETASSLVDLNRRESRHPLPSEERAF